MLVTTCDIVLISQVVRNGTICGLYYKHDYDCNDSRLYLMPIELSNIIEQRYAPNCGVTFTIENLDNRRL